MVQRAATDAATTPGQGVELLPVVETFHSLQGEGVHGGRSAFFIRLGGCSVGCRWCDTKHSWPGADHPFSPIAQLGEDAAGAVAAGAAFVVVTGGEPLHHNLDALCHTLRNTVLNSSGQAVPLHLETSGVDPLSGRFDWITLSPKRHRPPTRELLAACHELKVVVHDRDDLVFAQAMAAAASAHRAQPPTDPPALLIQPGHGCAEGQQLAIAFVKTHPLWRLSLQTHKLLGVR